ncbi:hypothetical protein B0T25DRAFT_95618 [Lasiosphaeria hispida]|uniref:Ubiquitin-like domain-containing protein n=1 Tax=Lasiosphaeria hispida TaxID=260671 RepID=A0AAJ0HQ13_9PEZI|nr:hypothetical protein B0T25DRAFT_95618 [Lasiosphaeria hispida]
MVEMADDSTGPSQPAPRDAAPLTANLQIVSPSVGIGPLVFPTLAPDTTVRQLKERIREALPSHPADDHQRLIHRGRLLARDSDTLQDIFTEEQLRGGDQQTLHLVLRDVADHPGPAHVPSQPTPLRGQSPAPGSAPMRPDSQAHHHHHPQHHPQRRVLAQGGLPHALHAAAPGFPNMAQMPHAQAGMAQMMAQQQQQQHQSMVQWMNQLQREAGYRQYLTQQQRERAAMGAHVFQDGNTNAGANAQGNATEHTGGRNSPANPVPTQTVTREVIGPNGQYWRMTVNETVGGSGTNPPQTGSGSAPNPAGRGPLSPVDVASIMRGADATQATQAMANAMHRSTSGASLASMANLANFNGPIQPIQPGVTTPLFPGTSRHASRTATPDFSARPVSHGSSNPSVIPQSQAVAHLPPGQPEVYILSSPTGPRGLLMMNGGSEMYVTPAGRQPNLGPFSFQTTIRQQLPLPPHSWHPQTQTYQPQPPLRQPPGQAQPQAQLQLQPQPQPQPQVQVQVRVGQQQQPPQLRNRHPQQPQQVPVHAVQPHPVNPGAVALAAAAWPHIWLIIRLVVFVWWFTSNDPSWSRWVTMVAIAIAVFALNTGLLNGFANQAWDPFRQHLEGLIPLVDPNRQQREAQPVAPPEPAAPNGDARAAAATGGQPADPNPAQVARRLVADRRNANANWLLDTVRRFERAGLLFLASIAPGVAERHIANLEAQERAERQRREAEETATAEAAAAAAAATAATAAVSEQESNTQDGVNNQGNQDPAPQIGQQTAREQPPAIQV